MNLATEIVDLENRLKEDRRKLVEAAEALAVEADVALNNINDLFLDWLKAWPESKVVASVEEAAQKEAEISSVKQQIALWNRSFNDTKNIIFSQKKVVLFAEALDLDVTGNWIKARKAHLELKGYAVPDLIQDVDSLWDTAENTTVDLLAVDFTVKMGPLGDILADDDAIGYFRIMQGYAKYQETPNGAPEEKRRLLLQMRSDIDQWLYEHPKPVGEDVDRAKSLNELRPELEKHLLTIGMYIAAHDNYLEVVNDYAKVNQSLTWVDGLSKEDLGRGAILSNVIHEHAPTIERIVEQIQKWMQLYPDSKDIGIREKRAKLEAILRRITRFYEVNELPLGDALGAALKKFQRKPYDTAKDKLIGEIRSSLKELVGSKKDAEKRYQMAGTLLDMVSRWKTSSLLYQTSEAFKQAQTEVNTISDQVDALFKAVFAELSFIRIAKQIRSVFEQFSTANKEAGEQPSAKKNKLMITLSHRGAELGARARESYDLLPPLLQRELRTEYDYLLLISRHFKVALFKRTGGLDGMSLFMEIVQTYESQTYVIAPKDTPGEITVKTGICNALLNQIERWEKAVVLDDPELKPSIDTINEIKEEVLGQVSLLKGHFTGKDPLFDKIEMQFLVYRDGKIADPRERWDILQYLAKLVDYWKKANPKENVTNAKKYALIRSVQKAISDSFSLEEFEALRNEDAVRVAIAKAEAYLDQKAKGVLRQASALRAQMVISALDELRLKLLADEEKICKESHQALTKIVEDNEKDILDKLQLWTSKLDDDLAKLIKDYHPQFVKIERVVFSTIGDYDLDPAGIGQIDAATTVQMHRAMESAIERSMAILETTGDLQEAERLVAHIPVPLLPDRFVMLLQSYRKVQRAFVEEEQHLAKTEAEEELRMAGLTDLLSEAGAGQSAEFGKTMFECYKNYISTTWVNQDNFQDPTGASIKIARNPTPGSGEVTPVAFAGTVFMDTFKTVAVTVPGILKAYKAGKETPDPLSEEEVANYHKTMAQVGLRLTADILRTLAKGSAKRGIPELPHNALEKVTIAVAGILSLVAECLEDGKDVSLDDLPSTLQANIDKNIGRFEAYGSNLLELGSSITKVVDLFATVPVMVLPILGIVNSTIAIGINAQRMHQTYQLQVGTKELRSVAESEGKIDYLGPLDQELRNLRKKQVKKALDTALETVTITGLSLTASGVGAVAGGAVISAAGIAKFAIEFGFVAVDEVELYRARQLEERAKNGDREAMVEIMSQSARYAKMFLILGALEEDVVALEFLRQRGIKEKDLENDAKLSAVVLRRLLRQKLLEKTGEKDSHDSRFTEVGSVVSNIREWYRGLQEERAFWGENTQRNFDLFHKIYNLPQFRKLVADYNAKLPIAAKATGTNKQNMREICKTIVDQEVYMKKVLDEANLEVQRLEEEDQNLRETRPTLRAKLDRAIEERSLVTQRLGIVRAFIKEAGELPEDIITGIPGIVAAG